MTIVLLFGGLLSYANDPSPTGVQDSTVKISIDIIRAANVKLIQAKYDAELVLIQDSIIKDYKNIVLEFDKLNKDLQSRIIKGNEINNELANQVDKYKRRSKRASWAAVGSGSAFIVLLILIL